MSISRCFFTLLHPQTTNLNLDDPKQNSTHQLCSFIPTGTAGSSAPTGVTLQRHPEEKVWRVVFAEAKGIQEEGQDRQGRVELGASCIFARLNNNNNKTDTPPLARRPRKRKQL